MNDDLPKPEERTRLMIIGAVARAARCRIGRRHHGLRRWQQQRAG